MEPSPYYVEIIMDPFIPSIQVTGDYYADEYGNVGIAINAVYLGSANITKDVNLGGIVNKVRDRLSQFYL